MNNFASLEDIILILQKIKELKIYSTNLNLLYSLSENDLS